MFLNIVAFGKSQLLVAGRASQSNKKKPQKEREAFASLVGSRTSFLAGNSSGTFTLLLQLVSATFINNSLCSSLDVTVRDRSANSVHCLGYFKQISYLKYGAP